MSVIQICPGTELLKIISMTYFSDTNAMRVYFKTHTFNVFVGLDFGLKHCVLTLLGGHSSFYVIRTLQLTIALPELR